MYGDRLMLAAFSGQIGSVKELCYHGANKQVTDNGGSTVLHWAMDGDNTELVDWLLDNGADLNATDVNGWTPLLRICTLLYFSTTTVVYPRNRLVKPHNVPKLAYLYQFTLQCNVSKEITLIRRNLLNSMGAVV